MLEVDYESTTYVLFTIAMLSNTMFGQFVIEIE